MTRERGSPNSQSFLNPALCIFPNVVLCISVKLEVGSQEFVLILDIQGDDGGI